MFALLFGWTGWATCCGTGVRVITETDAVAHNVLLAYKPHTTQHKTARLFLEDVQALKEFSVGHETAPSSTASTSTPAANASGPSGSSSSTTRAERPHGSKARSGFRKSQRHH